MRHIYIEQKKKTDKYLSHHGIEGQKWGVRRGPPYPLDTAAGGQIERTAPTAKGKNQSKAMQAIDHSLRKEAESKWKNLLLIPWKN